MGKSGGLSEIAFSSHLKLASSFPSPAPDHQPQECFGLLECMHNNIQTQTQIAQAQLTLLEDMRESMNLLLTRERQSQTQELSAGQERAPKGLASPPHPIS